MTATGDELLRRANRFAERSGIALREQLGYGIHGIVFVAEYQSEPGRSAVKVHEREAPYRRERDIYLRLQDRGISTIQGCHVPQLIRFDDELWVIEMEVVTRPFVLDFAGAYLDQRPDYSVEVMAEWRADKQEQFGDRWSDVESILASLAHHGIYMADVSPNNIALADDG